MTTRLFRVDMSEGSRDFAAVATEPGLAMLDSAGANYALLRRWFGALVAEPELQTQELVSFYVREADQGRLENLTCASATLKDLRGPLKPELDNIEAAIRKAKPESTNEKLLHKIVAKTFKEQTAELEKSDFDCYFFKYRQPGGPWRLVWCWGYQRRDHEPSRGVICTNPDCQRLFAHRPKTKRRCPHCQTIAVRKRRRTVVDIWPAVLMVLVLAALLGGLVAWLLRPIDVPKRDLLTVKPESVEMAVGQRLDLDVSSDTPGAISSKSSDPGVVEVLGTRTLSARKAGKTDVAFTLGNITRMVHVNVAAATYKSIEIRPAALSLQVGESKPLKIIGITSDGRDVPLGGDQLTWLRQPSASQVEINRATMDVRALAVTQTAAPLEVQLGELPVAKAEITVTAAPAPVATTTGATTGSTAPVTVVDDAWSVYPPVAINRPGTVMTAGPQLGAPLRFVPGQGLIADNIVAGSPLELAGVVPGSAISHIDGTDISHYSPAQLKDYLTQKPISDGTVLGVIGADGKLRDNVKIGIDARVLLPVQVSGIKPVNVTAGTFDAAVVIRVRDRAEYRIVNDAGKDVSPWSTHGPQAEATIQITQIPRSASKNEYDMYVERRLGADVKRYPFVISLSAAPK